MPQSFSIPISRRDLLKLAGVTAAGVVLSGTSEIPRAEAAEKISGESIKYANKKIPVLFSVDVCVCGGGPAGTAAAVNAARKDVSVVLIERGVALGGLGVLGCVYPFMDTHAPNSDTPYVAELKKRLRQKGIEPFDGVTQQTWHNPETLALIHDEMCEEAGVNVLYQAVVVDSLAGGGKISAVIVQTIAGLAAIKAKTFIDATGDAYLARCSGVEYECGYEKTGNNQPLSFRFEMGGIDTQKLYNYVAIELQEDWCKSKLPYFEIAEAMHRKQRYKLEAFMARGVETGEITQEEAEYMQAYTIIGKNGVMSMNCPEIPVKFKATDPVSYSKAVVYGRKMMRNIARYRERFHQPRSRHVGRKGVVAHSRQVLHGRGRLSQPKPFPRRRLSHSLVHRRARRKSFRETSQGRLLRNSLPRTYQRQSFKFNRRGSLYQREFHFAGVHEDSADLREYRRGGGHCGGVRRKKSRRGKPNRLGDNSRSQSQLRKRRIIHHGKNF